MLASSGGFLDRLAHFFIWWWFWSSPAFPYTAARWVVRVCGVIGVTTAAAMLVLARPNTPRLPLQPPQEEGASLGWIAFFLLVGVPGIALIAAGLLTASPVIGAVVVIGALLTPLLYLPRSFVRLIRGGERARRSSDGSRSDPTREADVSAADTVASIALCLREGGYPDEASASSVLPVFRNEN